MTFHGGNKGDGKHYWLTPPALYAELDAEFHFTFDACPFPRPDGFDGLTAEWGERTYVNPPFAGTNEPGVRGRGVTAWVRKCIEEAGKGKLVVLVYPLDKWVFLAMEAAGCKLRNLGDVRWCATEDGTPGRGTGRHTGCFVMDGRL